MCNVRTWSWSLSVTITIGHYLLLIESITCGAKYRKVFPETIIIIIVSSSCMFYFPLRRLHSHWQRSILVVNTSFKPYIDGLNARKWICAKIECVLRLRLPVKRTETNGDDETSRKKRREKPFQIVAFAINNCHFTDSPTPSIYLSTTYTTPYLYCRSFNKNKNDTTSTEWIRTNERKKMANSEDFFLFASNLVTWSPYCCVSFGRRWRASTLHGEFSHSGFTARKVKPFRCHYVDINILITNFPFCLGAPSMAATIVYLRMRRRTNNKNKIEKVIFSLAHSHFLVRNVSFSFLLLLLLVCHHRRHKNCPRHLSLGEKQCAHLMWTGVL